jgi:GT2 family glycosyltransferase
MSSPLVSLVILNYNTPELVYDCLASIERHLGVTYEIIVVDNASSKPVDKARVEGFAHTRCLLLDSNRGFGSGNNAGAALATGTYLWLLNSDTLLVDSSMDQLFQDIQQETKLGAVSPLLYNDLQLQQMQPDFYANFQTLPSLVLRNGRPPLDMSATLFSTQVIVGASFILPLALFQELGGFDEQIFMFFEDDDLCYRIQQKGLPVYVYTKARIVHLQGKSIATNVRRKKLYYASQDYFWNKHRGSLAAGIMRLLRLPVLLRLRLSTRASQPDGK